MTPGAYYSFKVEARNTVGYSLYSEVLTILCAQPPDQIDPPTTVESSSQVILTWDAPWNGGAQITAYQVKFLQSDDSTYTESTSLCDGSLSATITSRTCIIASTSFTEAPYNIEWGSSVYATIRATNIKGDSVVSLAGNGAVILRIPDAPINLRNVPSVTSATIIGIEWDDGVNNGGTEVIDYLIQYAAVPNDYVTLAAGE